MKRFYPLQVILLAIAVLFSACAPAAAPAAAPTTVPTTAPTTAPTVEASATTAATATAAVNAATAAPTATTAAASGSAPVGGPVSVQDGTGAEIKLDQPAQKVISLAPSNTEIMYAVGAGKQVIGRDDFSNFPEEVKAVPSIGGNMGKLNLEQITSLQPDLILASPLTPADQIKALKDISANVFVVPNPKNLDDLYANLVSVGRLTGHEDQALTLAKDLSARANAVQEKLAGVKDKPTVFYELDATDPAKPYTAGPGTFIDLLINMAGGQNIGGSLKGEWAQISQEELIVKNPDVILLGDSLYGGITPASVAARPGWANIKAVKDNRVLEFNDDLVSRPGPRMIQGLEALAKVLHPDLFK